MINQYNSIIIKVSLIRKTYVIGLLISRPSSNIVYVINLNGDSKT